MRNSLKNIVYERVKQQKNMTDVDLLNELKKEDSGINIKELNKVLLTLEIMGLVTVRWVRKDTKRIEIIEKMG